MPSPFPRAVTSLAADRFGPPLLGLVIAIALGAAWCAWFLVAEVALYEVSARARLETAQAAAPVQAPVDGRIVATALELGRAVQPGDELAQIESDAQRFEQQERDSKLAAGGAALASLNRQLALVARTGVDEQQASRAAIDVARSQLNEAEAPAALADEDVARLERLRRDGLVTDADLSRARAEAVRRRAVVDSARLAIRRLELEQATRDRDREAHLQQLRGELARVEGERVEGRAALGRLQFEVARRTIRADVAGVIGEARVLRPGAFVKQGETLAAIVPSGIARVVAEYRPAAALGRISPGQPARVRLDGFPWTQYGSVPAIVERVAGEVRDGTIRVEMRVDTSAPATLPLQHGLPGSVEVEVERITPARLALRLAGRVLSTPRVNGADAASR